MSARAAGSHSLAPSSREQLTSWGPLQATGSLEFPCAQAWPPPHALCQARAAPSALYQPRMALGGVRNFPWLLGGGGGAAPSHPDWQRAWKWGWVSPGHLPPRVALSQVDLCNVKCTTGYNVVASSPIARVYSC